MLIPIWFAIFYPIFVMFFFVMLIIVSRKYPFYSIFSRTISGLATKNCEGNKTFKKIVILMGLVNIIFVYFLFLNLKTSTLGLAGTIFLAFGGVFFIITSFVTEEHWKPHRIIGGIYFAASIFGILILFYPFISATWIPKWLLIFNFLPLIISIFGFNAHLRNLDYVPDVRKPILDNVNFWEWMVFFSITLWFVLVYLVMIA